MSETVGEVMRRLFGVYDYVAFQDQRKTDIRKWSKVTDTQESRKFKSYRIRNGLELSKKMNVPDDGMFKLYLVFEM